MLFEIVKGLSTNVIIDNVNPVCYRKPDPEYRIKWDEKGKTVTLEEKDRKWWDARVY